MKRIVVSVIIAVVAATGAVALAAPAQAAPGGPPLTDFNGDGYGDVLGGLTYRSVDGMWGAGGVRVVYGSASGLNPATSVVLTEQSPGVAGVSRSNGNFGQAVATGDFDGDGYSDAAVSSKDDSNVGQVAIVYGGPTGLAGIASSQSKGELLTPGSLLGVASTNLSFGRSLAVGDFNDDGRADLGIGVPLFATRGGVLVLHGSVAGLLPATNLLVFSQLTPGLPELPAYLGWSVAAGDFNGDGRDDLAVNSLNHLVNGHPSAGAVFVFPSDASGVLSTAGSVVLTRDTPGVPGDAGNSDNFGRVLAAGDVTGDGKAELFVGTPMEFENGTIVFDGFVTIFKGSATGITATGVQQFTGVAGSRAGSSFAAFNADGDAYWELAVGAPARSSDSVQQFGAVQVFKGTANGPQLVGHQVWTQNSSGVLDLNEDSDQFGQALLGVSTPSGYDDLVIGVAYEDVTTQSGCGALAVLHSGPTGLTATGNQFIGGPSLPGSAANDGLGYVLG